MGEVQGNILELVRRDGIQCIKRGMGLRFTDCEFTLTEKAEGMAQMQLDGQMWQDPKEDLFQLPLFSQ